jgi:lipopolysaccharide/colanic/teichoic acid biosynthesis glycosyltransferase
MRRLPGRVERVLDLAFAAAGLVFLAPVFAGIALWVLWDDGTPVFFRQTRVGWKGKPFVIWKFRTMSVGARGRAITAAGDRRITRAGSWLRKLKLDELPQLFNVLRGDMSLIGPRPEVPEYVQFDSTLWQAVLQVRPGITDLATLMHRDEEEILGGSGDPHAFYRETVLPAKLRMNLAYLRSRSCWQDFRLILLTIRCSFFPGTFNRDYVSKVLDIGVGTHDAAYFHSLSYTVDR